MKASADKRTEEKPYFHGGKRGLKVDDYILAPSITGVSQNGEVPEEIRGKDHIYMVRNFVEAAPWAAQHSDAVIYEVEPEGTIEDDPDVKKPGLSYRCPKAKIVAVHEIPADMLSAARNLLLR